MKSTSVETITSNEQYVRMRIYDGDLQVSEASAELLRLERAQHDATRLQLRECNERLAEALSAKVIGGMRKGRVA